VSVILAMATFSHI